MSIAGYFGPAVASVLMLLRARTAKKGDGPPKLSAALFLLGAVLLGASLFLES